MTVRYTSLAPPRRAPFKMHDSAAASESDRCHASFPLSHASQGLPSQDGSIIADGVPPADVQRRIEELVRIFLKALTATPQRIPAFGLVQTNSGVLSVTDHTDDGKISSMASKQLRFSGKSRGAYVRVWKVLQAVYRSLVLGRMATQRELYYCLVSECPSFIRNQRDVNGAIQDAVSVLGCSRRSLGVNASSRGSVAGRLLIKTSPCSPWVDCTKQGTAGHSITGNISCIDSMALASDARYILIVEKDAVFQRLTEDKIYSRLPCIIITAKGFPDLATRAFLHKVSTQFFNLPLLGLFDMNPPGLSILCTFKFGMGRMELEGTRYACDIKWLGLRPSEMDMLDACSLQPLTARDRAMGKKLRSKTSLQAFPSYLEELETMLRHGVRAELEAVYGRGQMTLSAYITEKIVKMDYL